MAKILVIGATGFVGGYLARALVQAGHQVRCFARNPDRIASMASDNCEIVQGDILDAASVRAALESVNAVYISIHTLSTQRGKTEGQGFMDLEIEGLQNIIEGCRVTGVRRLVYLTFLGIRPDSSNTWNAGRWKAEQMLFKSGLDVTSVRPGQIVGKGGYGFNTMLAQARRRVAVMMGNGNQAWRNIAVDDLVYYMIGVLDDTRSFGQAYDVGSDDVLTYRQMIDVASELLGTRRPWKIQVPKGLILSLASTIERRNHLPKGALRGLFDGEEIDTVGSPEPIRAILPRQPLSYREAVKRAIVSE